MAERKRTTVELDADLLEWVKNNFPDISLSATINNLLSAYKEQYEIDPPDNYYIRGARHLKEHLDRDLRSLDEHS